MTIEDSLKNLILSRYRSVRDFAIKTDIPCSTVNGIIKRGVQNSSVSNVIKVCQALNISADDLASGKITPITPSDESIGIELSDLLQMHRMKLVDHNITINGERISAFDAELLIDSMEMAIEFIKKRHQRG
ncbi:MAG: helix-turn-helix transcriptional regulator [Lachnospiraceae bacterium]|nr:helix-turn-helix transcriptional regulator [Lachnospiraceae bacterium]